MICPGSLPKGMKMQDILSGKLASNPRNKQIASIFKEAGIIEKYGSGIKRVMQSMADAGSPAPVFEAIADNFKVTLFPKDKKTAFLKHIISNSSQLRRSDPK
jgi:ATP-dependent DNA helicase RecG